MSGPRAPHDGRPPTMRGAVAGSLLVATIVVCAAIGFGLVGLFAGVVLGIVLVIRRFGDI
jgi:hypothetical protein